MKLIETALKRSAQTVLSIFYFFVLLESLVKVLNLDKAPFFTRVTREFPEYTGRSCTSTLLRVPKLLRQNHCHPLQRLRLPFLHDAVPLLQRSLQSIHSCLHFPSYYRRSGFPGGYTVPDFRYC